MSKQPYNDEELAKLATADDAAGNEQLKAAEESEAFDAINKYTEEESEKDEEISFKSIFGGDILKSRFMMKQIVWFMLVVVLMIIYTANRYSAQHDIIKISELREELQEMKYKVLTQSSDLMNKTRQSNIEAYLKQTNDSTLVNPTHPPYLIK